jgi:hypothetical protein
LHPSIKIIKMQKFIESNKKTIITALGVGAAAAAAVFAIYQISNNQKKVVQVAPVADRGELTKLEKANIIASIKIEYIGDILTVESIKQISDAVVKFAFPEFLQLTRQDREERRANKDNVDKYVELWETYTQRLEELIEKSQKAVLETLQISESVFERSNSHHISEHNQELFLLQATLLNRLKSGITGSKKLTLQEFRDIIKTQIELMLKEADYYKEISAKTKHPEEAAPIINNRVNDMIHAKYTVEEEDMTAAMTLYAEDPESINLFRDLQSANMKLLPLGDFF